MKRRTFITGVGPYAAVGTALMGAPAVHAAKHYAWKMATTWPPNFPGFGTGASKLAQAIEIMSDKRITITVYGAGELVPAFDTFDAVASGVADMGHAAAYYWTAKHPATAFFTTVPFGLNAQEIGAWISYGGGQALWDELYAPFNLKPFAAGNTGVQMGGWFNKEMRTLDDFKGLKMRIPGLGGDVLAGIGAQVVHLPGGEIHQAFKSKRIEAAEWVGPYNDLAFGLYQVAPYYYWPGWHEPGTVAELTVNRKRYESLPQDLQMVIQKAAQAAYSDMLGEYTAHNNGALATLVREHHVQLRQFPNAILGPLGKISQDMVAALGQTDAISKRIYASFDDFRRKAIDWGQIGEEAYSLARSLTSTP